MSIKMNQLTKLSGVPKATILYYIKEGLLPQPEKPKPNLHLYSQDCVEILSFIKYLQKNFDCSILEIQEIVSSEYYQTDNSYKLLLDAIHTIMGIKHQKKYNKDEIVTIFNIPLEEIDLMLEEGLIFQRDEVFTQKEIEMIQIIIDFKNLDIDIKLLKLYTKQARDLAKLEVEMANSLIETSKGKNDVIKKIFDTILILKPYIYNMTTLSEYQKNGI